ncbi:hypothetical protein IFHNHDMJ_00357 [Synechococcus sp. CBW1107]|nr:hypothetical protein IFHNHDMJ_00357 [Synechococcus sp. CBW1107]
MVLRKAKTSIDLSRYIGVMKEASPQETLLSPERVMPRLAN